jgi:zinc transport system ATP-binding protein
VHRFLALGISDLSTSLNDPLLQEFSVHGLLDRFLYDLSGGELQRVLFVKALLNKPSLLVLDEPAQGMDQKGQIQLYGILNKIQNLYQCAIVLVSHDLNFVFSNSHQVICINKHICCIGHPSEIQQDPAYQKLIAQSSLLSPYYHHHDHTHGFSPSGEGLPPS